MKLLRAMRTMSIKLCVPTKVCLKIEIEWNLVYIIFKQTLGYGQKSIFDCRNSSLRKHFGVSTCSLSELASLE